VFLTTKKKCTFTGTEEWNAEWKAFNYFDLYMRLLIENNIVAKIRWNEINIGEIS